jgi:hypothetical protein
MLAHDLPPTMVHSMTGSRAALPGESRHRARPGAAVAFPVRAMRPPRSVLLSGSPRLYRIDGRTRAAL